MAAYTLPPLGRRGGRHFTIVDRGKDQDAIAAVGLIQKGEPASRRGRAALGGVLQGFAAHWLGGDIKAQELLIPAQGLDVAEDDVFRPHGGGDESPLGV